MKIYLDDLRDPPDATWTVARTFDEFRELMDSGEPIETMSFDSDLGEGETEGRDILKWVGEHRPELLVSDGVDVTIHSADGPAAENMEGYLAWARSNREDFLEQQNRPYPFGKRE